MTRGISDSELKSVERICRAAEEEFGTRGLEAANVRVIAEQAGVSWQLVYRYFPKKEELYAETMARFTKRFYEHLLKVDTANQDPVEVIRTFAYQLTSLFSDFPFTGRLILDQILHQGRQIKPSTKANTLRESLLGELAGAIDTGVKAGFFRPGHSAEGLFFLTLVVALGYTAIGNLREYILLEVPELGANDDVAATVADVVLSTLSTSR